MEASRDKRTVSQEIEADMPTLDFMKSLDLSNLDQSLREKINLLQSYGKTFENGYLNQKELNGKLKQYIGQKEREYQSLGVEIKGLKERLTEMKTQNRSLEDNLAKALKDKEDLRNYCKKLQAKVEKLVKYAGALQQALKTMREGQNSVRDDRDLEELKEPGTFMRLDSGNIKGSLPSEVGLLYTDDGRKELNERENEHHVHFAEQKSSRSDSKSREESNRGKSVAPEKLLLQIKNTINYSQWIKKQERAKIVTQEHERNAKEQKNSSDRKETIFSDDEEEETKKNASFTLSNSPSGRKSSRNKQKSLTERKVASEVLEDASKRRASAHHDPSEELLRRSIVDLHAQLRITNRISSDLVTYVPGSEGIIKNREASPKFPMNHNSDKLKIFEEFFAIGITIEDVVQFEQLNPDQKSGALKPRILYNFPSNEEDLERPSRASVKEFCFPFGVEIKKERIKSNSNIYEIMFPKNTFDDNSNCFIFPLLPGEFANAIPDNEFLSEINPDGLLYHVCIKTSDFWDFGYIEEDPSATTAGGSKPRRKVRKIWKVSRIYCFMTFLPLTKLFMDINCSILNHMKITRMKLFSELSSKSREPLRQMDSNWSREFVKNEVEGYLKSLIEMNIPRFGSIFEFSHGDYDKVSTLIPNKNLAAVHAFASVFPIAFTYFPLEDLVYLLSCVMLERKIVVVSPNLALISATMSTIIAMLRPFKYTFPIIFSLPEVLLTICDAPGSILLGLNKGGDYVVKQRLWIEFPDCVFFVLTDDGIMLLSESELEHRTRIRVFEKLVEKLSPFYSRFNSEKSIIQEIEDPHKLTELNGKKTSPEAKGKSAKLSRYSNKESDPEIFEKIFQSVLTFHRETVLNHLPKNIIFSGKSHENEEIDYRATCQAVVLKNYSNKQFLEVFVNTQLFHYFLSEHYRQQTIDNSDKIK